MDEQLRSARLERQLDRLRSERVRKLVERQRK